MSLLYEVGPTHLGVAAALLIAGYLLTQISA